ncbi:MAG: lipoyl domain-containing protein [Firmicutes bacterium]|nr:lipoyl domain-containing protein [Bacillota bacterium]
MTKTPITVPVSMRPVKNEDSPCKNGPVYFQYKTAVLLWLKSEGEAVVQDEPVCQGEVDKKIVEFCAPVSGILSEICLADGEECKAGDILGYVTAGA